MITRATTSILKVQEQWADELAQGLNLICDQLIRIGAVKIILFGSFKTGRIQSESDLDLLIIMPDNKPGKVWLREISEDLDRPVPCDLLVFTGTELIHYGQSSQFLRQILNYGKIIYERR